MLTVDFDRLGVAPGHRAIDIGAGAGRHSFELYRRGADVVAFDRSADDMKAVALNLMKFFEDESCGQCTPCRVGTEKAVKLMQQGPWNEALLEELSNAMRDASICGLGQAAPNPLVSVLKRFPDDLKKPLQNW